MIRFQPKISLIISNSYHSDEEEEDQDALLYIPLTLDIEYDEPDQNVPATPKKNQNQPLPKNKKRDQNQDNAVNYDSTNTYNIVP